MSRPFWIIGLLALSACGGSQDGASVTVDAAGGSDSQDGQFALDDSSVIIGPAKDTGELDDTVGTDGDAAPT